MEERRREERRMEDREERRGEEILRERRVERRGEWKREKVGEVSLRGGIREDRRMEENGRERSWIG